MHLKEGGALVPPWALWTGGRIVQKSGKDGTGRNQESGIGVSALLWVLDARCSMLDARCSMLVVRFEGISGRSKTVCNRIFGAVCCFSNGCNAGSHPGKGRRCKQKRHYQHPASSIQYPNQAGATTTRHYQYRASSIQHPPQSGLTAETALPAVGSWMLNVERSPL